MNVWRDELVVEPCLPELVVTPADVLAIVTQCLEVAGARPALTPESRPAALRAAADLLDALGHD